MRPNHQTIVRALRGNTRASERFWARVSKVDTPDGCWEWIGSSKPGAHPVFSVSRYTMGAARAAWFMETGELPVGGRVQPQCGNPLCVRPSHLHWHVGRRTELVLNAMNDGYVRLAQRASRKDEAA
jgi:hypothetical protein